MARPVRSLTTRSLLIGASVAGLACSGTAPAAAAPPTFAVTTTADGGAGSVREAVRQASAAGTAAVVRVPAGTYALTRCGADDTGAAGDLDLATAALVTIAGTGTVTIRQACAGERVLHARGGGRLVLDRLTITGGSVAGAAGAAAEGGGVHARATCC